MRGVRRLMCVIAGLVLALVARGQEASEEPEYERVAVRVVSVARKSVFLDHGSDAGIEPGDRVLLLPAGSSAVEATVRSVSSRSARAELDQPDVAVTADTPGEVLVPRERLAGPEGEPPAAEQGAPVAPEHPPWTQPAEAWDDELPLLAPVQAVEPEDREPDLHGRTFLHLDSTQDRYGQHSDYYFARTGIDLVWDNPFSHGGRLELDAEYVYRHAEVEDEPNEDDSEFRPRYLSYAWGETRTEPRHFEVGRFMQEGFPAFGLLDGVEFSQRVGERQLIGATVGFLTDMDLDLGTGNDQQVATYFRRELVSSEGLGWGVGAQKTWHHWDADRDLLAADVDWRPSEKLMCRGSVIVDYYTASDDMKSKGFELTEAHVYGSWRPSSNWGASVNADRIRWPEMKRNEFAPLPDGELRDRRYERLGLRVWRNVTKDVRVSTRGDLWGDQDESGAGGELRVDWSDLLWQDGRVSMTGFKNNGEYNDVEGLRVSLDKDTPAGLWSLEWQLMNIDHESDFSNDDALLQQSLRAGWDRSLGTAWDLSLFVEDRFGDGQDAVSAGLYLQHSF